MAPMDKAGKASDADPLESILILALEKNDSVARGPTVKAGVICFLPFHAGATGGLWNLPNGGEGNPGMAAFQSHPREEYPYAALL